VVSAAKSAQIELGGGRVEAPAVSAGQSYCSTSLPVYKVTRCPLPPTSVYRHKLELKAKFESGSSHFSIKCLVPGAFNAGLTGQAAPAYLGGHHAPGVVLVVAAQVELKSKV
jgi:hypothetical protein